ncbi:MAG TPA: amino acid adenylation domain-containing protein [Herpetosiphonaceae bacterium]
MDSQNLPTAGGLSAEELELLALLMEEEGLDAAAPQTILPRTQQTNLPLSFAQQRLWFLDQWEPGNPAYNIAFALRLTGRLNIAALQEALNTIVARHESLRTTFAQGAPAVDEQPVQVIAPAAAVPLPLTDLSQLPEAEREAEVRRRALASSHTIFDLARGPLFVAALLRLQADEHIVLFAMHHIISDGWSSGVFQREMIALYTAFSQGRPSPLAPLPIQYADFAIWQRGWLQGTVLDQQIDYWQRQLADLPVLELPTDRPRPPAQSYRGAYESFGMPLATLTALDEVSKRSGVTLFMTLLAAFQVLLSRYSGQLDLAVGSPIANRDLVEVEPLIGFFINTLILRADLSGNPRFCDLLIQTRDRTLDAYAHQNVPFEQLVEVLRPERDPSRPPLFQVMFALQNLPQGEHELPDLTITPLRPDGGASKFDMMVGMSATPMGLRGNIEYSTDLFDRETILRMARHFAVLLDGIGAAPERRIAELPLLTPEERQDLLVDWNARAVSFPAEACMHDLITAQAAHTLDTVAVVSGGESLTYRELNERANQLAHYLQRRGVGPEVPVGICLDRSSELIVAILAIWKAGGAYVPLDPGFPRERLQFLLHDAQVAVFVTQEQMVALLQAEDSRHRAEIVCLDVEAARIAEQPTHEPPSTSTAANLAYIIYTSGSTGQPKGTLVPQRSLVSAAAAWDDAYQLRATVRRHLQMANVTFDVFAGDLVRALTSGGTLVLCPRELLLEPDQLYALIVAHGIDCAEFVPAVLRGLLQHLADHDLTLDTMRLLVCGSDSWYIDEYRQVQRLCGPETRVVNSFGVTEATIDSTWFAAAVATNAPDQLIPIGRPFANTAIYILDRYGEPAPVGVPGELYIGGMGVARGYLHRPALTAERFIPDRFGQTRGARLYCTGDLARYLPDGVIEYLGRVDDQVKLRGFRIELGEIDAVLRQHAAVRDAVVVLREDQPGDARLVAYVVPDQNLEPRTKNLEDSAEPGSKFLVLGSTLGEGLRSFLAQRLPAYMIPSAFVFLDMLPMTTNGKIDRRALPAPVPDDGAQADAGPRTPTEELLATIWATVLGRERIGLHENFFDLGGHSLLATRVIARVRAAFQVDLPLTSLFESPTVAGMARQVEVALHVQQALTIPPIYPTGADRGPLSFFQHRFWMADQQDRGNPAFNMPTAVRLRGALDLPALEHSLNVVVERHAALRTIVVGDPPEQVILPMTTTPLPVFDLRSLPEAERQRELRRLVTEDVQGRFDLATGPLLRCGVVRLAAEEHVLLLNVHHIIFDGWSLGVLVRELTMVYVAAVAQRSPDSGEPAPPVTLPPLPIQYVDYAIWERQWLQGETVERLLDYWRQQLMPTGDPMSPVLALPTDYLRGEKRTYAGGHLSVRLSAELSAHVQALSRAESCTLFMTLLAAFNVLLWRVSGDTDIMVGTPSAGRALAETEHLVGLFLNMLPLRTRIVPEQTFQELLRAVRTTTLGAYTHQYLPMTVLVNALELPHDPRYNPLFQVSLNMLNTPDLMIELPGLTIEAVPADDHGSKIDFTIYAQETEGTIRLDLVYNTDLFTAGRMEALLRQFQNLLEAIVADPAQELTRLP